MSRSLPRLRWSQGWRRAALASTALSVIALGAPAAMAASSPPAANSLPSNYTTHAASGVSTTYALDSSSSTNKATITIKGAAGAGIALDFSKAGATPLTGVSGSALTSGATQNPGLSIGSGATLSITGASSSPLLLNDISGATSQIYGSVTDDGTGALYIANPNGVIVGASGSIDVGAAGTASGGVGLIGFAQDSSSFGGATSPSITVGSTVKGSGDVTVMSGASITMGEATKGTTGAGLLLASNGAINVGAQPVGEALVAGTKAPFTDAVSVVAGYTMNGTVSAPNVTSALSGASPSVTFAAGSSSNLTPVNSISVNGNVTNTGGTDFRPAASHISIAGSFTNSGVANVRGLSAGSISNGGVLIDSSTNDSSSTPSLVAMGSSGATSGADITNTGKIEVTGTSLTAKAGQASGGATGNFTNQGVITFTADPGAGVLPSNTLTVEAANIDFAGSATQTTHPLNGAATNNVALSTSTPLVGFTLDGYLVDSSGTPNGGVVDVASTIYSDGPQIQGQAVRILSGAVDATAGTGIITVGTGTVADPFANGASLGYNLSLYPNTSFSAPTVTLVGQEATSSAAGSMMNLGGMVGNGNAVTATADTINATPDGGFALKDGGTLSLNFSGNVNDPNGAMFAGGTAFQYNDVPVAVGNGASGGAGTATIKLDGPSASGSTAQFVNLLVSGNVILENDGAVPTILPGSNQPITAQSSSTNNHLVVQATGNVELTGPNAAVGGAAQFYWPGLTYLSTVKSASAPTTISNNGSITLGSSGGSVALNNILPSFITGGGGVYLETNNLNLNGADVSTSNNSWVNFANGASAYAKTSGKSFFDAYKDNVTSTLTELGLQQLPSDYFVDRLPQ